MSDQQCKSCGGTYAPIGSDNVPYAHACAPIVTVAITRGGQRQRIPLTELRDDDTITVRRGVATVEIPVKAIQADDLRLGDGAIERPNKRDENPILDLVDGKRTTRIRSEGAGVQPAPAPDPVLEGLADRAL